MLNAVLWPVYSRAPGVLPKYPGQARAPRAPVEPPAAGGHGHPRRGRWLGWQAALPRRRQEEADPSTENRPQKLEKYC